MSHDPYFDVAATFLRGYRHHAIRFTRWRDHHQRVGQRMAEVHKVERQGVELRQFMVARETLANGAHQWHVYRRLNPNAAGTEWRWLANFPFDGEAAAFIDDVVAGRTRVAFGGHRFKLKKADEVPAGTSSGDPEP